MGHYLTLGGFEGVGVGIAALCTAASSQLPQGLVQGLPGGAGGKGMVAGHAVWLPGKRWPLLSAAAPPRTEAGQRGQEDLAEVGGDQVVEDGIDGGADVEESIGEHVEIMVEVEEKPVEGREGV